MPEFVRLGRRTFCIVLADDNKGGGLHVFDEADRRTFLIYFGVVVNGCAEKRDHPLPDQVLAVITLPVCDARTCDGCVETICLRHCPHRHEAAVAPAGDAEAVRINRISLYRRIYSSEIVAQIAASEILDIGTGEVFT